ncbi:MAG: class I SAM-dependent methyltransferase [Myxococcales bacterium]|nr:class I SAM-dependent methyltransferase [Myxococcales bacterium]
MHDTALEYGDLFFKAYAGSESPKILDIGSADVNGSLRTVAPHSCDYVGVDFAPGPGVDVVITDPYTLPFEDNTFDLCVSTSVFEHSEFFWVLFVEILRVIKATGRLYMNAPSNGEVHRYPVDCWRFYPDSGRALERWAQHSGINAVLLESFIGRQHNDQWNDFIAVFAKDADHVSSNEPRILDRTNRFTNGYRFGHEGLLQPAQYQEDQHLMGSLMKAVRRSARPLTAPFKAKST